MSARTHDSLRFVQLLEDMLRGGHPVRFRASGWSMHPTIRDGDALTVTPTRPAALRKGDIVLSHQAGRLVAHRVVKLQKQNGRPASVLLRGDALSSCDRPIAPDAILAKVVIVERDGTRVDPASRRAKAAYQARRWVSRVRHSAAAILRRLRGTEVLPKDTKEP